jgi:superfamily II DNA/RNA helicase
VQIITEKYKYAFPSPIQSCIMPLLHKKQNVIGSSETGSGKTLSYLIPLIHNILLNKLKSEEEKVENLPHKALIILPTKELCMQIYNECLVFCKYYTKNNVKVKYLTQAMYNGIANDFDNFLRKNDIIVY